MYEDTSGEEKEWLGSYFIANYFALSKQMNQKAIVLSYSQFSIYSDAIS